MNYSGFWKKMQGTNKNVRMNLYFGHVLMWFYEGYKLIWEWRLKKFDKQTCENYNRGMCEKENKKR